MRRLVSFCLCLLPKLRKKHQSVQLPALPGKVIFGSMDKENIEKRRNGLENYLQKLVKISTILSSDIFFKYFQFTPFVKNDKSTSMQRGLVQFFSQLQTPLNLQRPLNPKY